MASIWNRLWWGGDPDVQDDDTGLSKRDVYNIQRSWAVMYSEQEKYGMELFLRLFRLDPASQNFFKLIRHLKEDEIKRSFQFRAHVINLMTSVNSAVINIHQPEVVVALMNKLGESHHSRKVQRTHFDKVKTVFVDILQNELKLQDNVVASWGRFVDFIYKHIFEKLCDSKHFTNTNL